MNSTAKALGFLILMIFTLFFWGTMIVCALWNHRLPAGWEVCVATNLTWFVIACWIGAR